jgi:WD40 repeat protein
MLIMPSGEYKPLPTPKQAEAVAWCMVNDFHEFRNSRNGDYVSSIRCEQIENDRGDHATSKDGKWFAFISEYKDEETATVQTGLPKKSTDNSEPRLVNGPASHKVGYKQGAREIYGVEVYNVLTQELVASFPVGKDESGRSGKIFIGVQLDPTKNRMVVGTSSTIHIYDVKSGERTSTIRPVPSDDSVTYTSLAVAGDYAAIGDTLGIVRIVNLETKQLVETIPSREKRPVTHVDLSQDAKTLTYHADGVAHIVHLKIVE